MTIEELMEKHNDPNFDILADMIRPLSPDEIRESLKYDLWKEKDDKMLLERLKFYVNELEK